MRKLVCGHCGTKITKEKDEFHAGVFTWKAWNFANEDTEFDTVICDSCAEKLKDWLNGKGTEEKSE